MKVFRVLAVFLFIGSTSSSQPDSFPVHQVHPGSEWALTSTTFGDHTILPTTTTYCNASWLIPAMPPVQLTFQPNTDPFPVSGLVLPYYLPTTTTNFFQSRTPFTSLLAQFGSGNEQYFSAMHSQSISERTNFTATISRSNGEGIYLRQKFFSENYSLTFFHRPKKNRYAITLQGQYQSLKKEENGGLAIDSLFSENIFTNRKLIPIKLDNASSKVRSRFLRIDQYFLFSKDSIWNTKRKGSFLRVGLVARDHFRSYSDDAVDFANYPAVFLDSTVTNDSVSFSRLKVDLMLTVSLNKWSIELGGESQANDYWNFGFDSIMIDHAIKGSIWRNGKQGDWGSGKSEFWNMFGYEEWRNGRQDDWRSGREEDWKTRRVEISGIYILAGPSKGNFNGTFSIPDIFASTTTSADSIPVSIGIFASTNASRSPLFFSHYSSNHYAWDNQLSKEFSYAQYSTGRLDIGIKKIRTGFSVSYNSLVGHTYFSSNGTPTWAPPISWINITTHAKIKLKRWVFELLGDYRATKDTLLPIPAIHSKLNLYWQKDFTGKKIWVRIGVSAEYISAYYPGNYSPALGMFTYSRAESVGDYIYPSLYVALRVGPAHVFVKADHVTAGLFGSDYFVAPGYPAADRLIRFGLSWKFFD